VEDLGELVIAAEELPSRFELGAIVAEEADHPESQLAVVLELPCELARRAPAAHHEYIAEVAAVPHANDAEPDA
jgi:hypothetical protein